MTWPDDGPQEAIFGTSRQLVVAGTSASAILVFSAVTALGAKNAASYATLAAGMIVLAGLIFIVAGLLRLGFITAFLSRPVMEGFVFGLAVFVTVSQDRCTFPGSSGCRAQLPDHVGVPAVLAGLSGVLS